MKAFIFIIFISFSLQLSSQRLISTAGGCVSMYGDADVDNNGMWYYALIRNECSSPVYIGKSKFKARFEYETTKTHHTTKTISFPGVFLAAGTSITKDKTRKDNSSKVYTDLMWRKGEMGSAYTCSSGSPTSSAIRIMKNTQVFIGKKGTVDFYISLSTASDSWRGFTRYKVTLIAKNTSSAKAKIGAYLNYKVYFQGISFSGDLSVKKLGSYKTKRKSERENPIFNFVPEVYIVITSSNINMGGSPGGSVPVESYASTSSSSDYSSSAPPAASYKKIDFSNIEIIHKSGSSDNISVVDKTSGDTIYRDIVSFETEKYTYSKMDFDAIDNNGFKGKHLVLIRSGSQPFVYYNPLENTLEKYALFEYSNIGASTFAIRRKYGSSKTELVNLTKDMLLKSFPYKYMARVHNSPSTVADLLYISKNSSGLKGIVNAFGATVLPFSYSNITYQTNTGNYIVSKTKQTKWTVKKLVGIIGSNMKTKIPCKYDYTAGPWQGHYLVYKNISVGKKIKTVNGIAYYELSKYSITICDSKGKEVLKLGRLNYVSLESGKLIANKKVITNPSAIQVLIENGQVVKIINPASSDLTFQNDGKCLSFEDVNNLILFAE